MTTNSIGNSIVLACDMSALNSEQHTLHIATSEKLFAAVLEIQELEQGYTFRLPAENVWLGEVAAFMTNERLCCPFLEFTVTLEPQSAALWLALTAQTKPEDIKLFLRYELGDHLPDTIAQQIGWR